MGESLTLANFGNGHEFISKEYIFRSFRKLKVKLRELMLKVDSIILLWSVEAESKVTRAYAQSEQYHIIVEREHDMIESAF